MTDSSVRILGKQLRTLLQICKDLFLKNIVANVFNENGICLEHYDGFNAILRQLGMKRLNKCHVPSMVG